MSSQLHSSRGVVSSIKTLFELGYAGRLSDGELVDRFVGDRNIDAFTELVRRHGPMVLRVAHEVLGDSNCADDAFQATFLVLLRNARKVRRRASIATWLHGVARRVALKQRAQTQRRAQVERAAARITLRDAFDFAREQQQAIDMHSEIARLPENQRLPLLLCYYEGLTHDQAAARLGWPVGTVRGRLARARDRLRQRLGDNGAASILVLAHARPAPIPPRLLDAVVALAQRFTATGSVIPSSVVTLAQGVSNPMMLGPMMRLTIAVFVCGLAGVAAATMGHPARTTQASAATQSPAAPSDAPQPAVRVYSVGDLLNPLWPDGGSKREPELLIEMLTANIAPGTWRGRELDGSRAGAEDLKTAASKPGVIAIYDGGQLKVAHLPATHDQITVFLARMRRFANHADPQPNDRPPSQSSTNPSTTPSKGDDQANKDRADAKAPHVVSAGSSNRTAFMRHFVVADEYYLQRGDRVRVHVGPRGLKPIDRETIVDDQGMLDLGPAYGSVRVFGMSPKSAKAAIALHLRQTMTDVQLGLAAVVDGKLRTIAPEDTDEVTLKIRPYNIPSITIEGIVTARGTYALENATTLVQALQSAGGFPERSRPAFIRILRSDGKSTTATDISVADFRAQKANPDGVKQSELKDGDRVIVFTEDGGQLVAKPQTASAPETESQNPDGLEAAQSPTPNDPSAHMQRQMETQDERLNALESKLDEILSTLKRMER